MELGQLKKNLGQFIFALISDTATPNATGHVTSLTFICAVTDVQRMQCK